ncbi:hypothetical protein A0J61_08273 [Choanephora cucurbitarum]|uniref:Uncharacterized protein n=1 Tax=Choanephora cucurbitarum TaxID=101091 RepID=A0A1C7N3F9_9FUNG|nr:hypothetical protein A0J61_08273 [Choanephora cucurbitarum]
MSSQTENNIITALNQIVTQNRYAALQNMRLTYNYVPGSNIELWLRLYHEKGQRLGLDDNMLIDQLPSYLPLDMTQWILSSPSLNTWKKTKEALIQTYGIPVATQKQMCKEKLESLQQGTFPTRQFKARFELILQELPEGASLSTEVLRSIYLHTWDKVANKAISIEDMLVADHQLTAAHLFGGHAPLSTPTPPPVSTSMPFTQPQALVSPHSGPSPMKIDAFRPRERDRKPHSNYVEQTPAADAPNWVPYGSPDNEVPPPTSASVKYAVVPEVEEPLPLDNKDAIHSLCYLSQAVKYREGSTLKCTLLGQDTTCLIDTGATVSAISEKLECSLSITIDASQRLCFTTAIGQDTWTHGAAEVRILLGEIPMRFRCHVVDQLAYPIIVGVRDLKAHKAVIDLSSNTIQFPGSSVGVSLGSLSGGLSGSLSGGFIGSDPAPATTHGFFVKAPKRYLDKPHGCVMSDTLKLPGHHHAYCTIRGPRNTLAMVTTPTDLAAKSLVAVAAGIVQFDDQGQAIVKLANLDIKNQIINKGQRIAIAELTQTSLCCGSVGKHPCTGQECHAVQQTSPNTDIPTWRRCAGILCCPVELINGAFWKDNSKLAWFLSGN